MPNDEFNPGLARDEVEVLTPTLNHVVYYNDQNQKIGAKTTFHGLGDDGPTILALALGWNGVNIRLSPSNDPRVGEAASGFAITADTVGARRIAIALLAYADIVDTVAAHAATMPEKANDDEIAS